MGERISTRIDRRTGKVTESSHRTDSGLGFDERMKGMIAEGMEQLGSEPEQVVAAVVCDGCGARTALDARDPKLPTGWSEAPDGDFCPACTLKRAV
jgi:hypothetical protein